jgi:transcriptional regulator with XRE-family HTH domain
MDMRHRIQAVISADPNLSVRGVSLAAGMSDSMLDKFLKKKTDSMTLKNAENLAKALGVDFIWLISGEGDATRATEMAQKIERLSPEQKTLVEDLVIQLQRTGTGG